VLIARWGAPRSPLSGRSSGGEQTFRPIERRIWNSGSDVPLSADCAPLALAQLEGVLWPTGRPLGSSPRSRPSALPAANRRSCTQSPQQRRRHPPSPLP
jgi:hypothetical protein